MPISAAAATLASGGMQFGGSFLAGILGYFSTKNTNKMNREIFDIQRADTKEQNREQNKISKAQLQLAGRQQAFTEKESGLNRTEALEQKGYGRMQTAYQRGADLLTQQMNMNATRAAPLIRSK